MTTRDDLKNWVTNALRELGGQASIPHVAEHIWKNHELELRASGALLFTWQYDMRWAATMLRKNGILALPHVSERGKWMLKH